MSEMNAFDKKILKAIRQLAPLDRDLKTITIVLNTNKKYGGDQDFSIIVEEALKKMVKKKVLKRRKKKITFFTRNGSTSESLIFYNPVEDNVNLQKC